MSLSLQQQKYVRESTLRYVLSLIKATEKEKRGSLPNWWSLWGNMRKILDPHLVQAINMLILELHKYLASSGKELQVLSILGWAEERETLRKILLEYSRKEPDLAWVCNRIIYEIQLCLYNVGLYQLPPAIIDLEEPPEGDVVFGGEAVEAESVSPPSEGDVNDSSETIGKISV